MEKNASAPLTRPMSNLFINMLGLCTFRFGTLCLIIIIMIIINRMMMIMMMKMIMMMIRNRMITIIKQ